MEQWTEWANALRGGEEHAEWTTDREQAARDVELDLEDGLDVRLIERTVTISDWRESPVPSEDYRQGP